MTKAGRILVAAAVINLLAGWVTAAGFTITTSSGMQFVGKAAFIGSINDNPLNSQVATQQIALIDDELRRIFIPRRTIVSSVANPLTHETIRIDQQVARSGRRIGTVGPTIDISPFDNFGRRTYAMIGPRGPLPVIQGITEISPTYTKVEGLLPTAVVWDMRIATSSLPRETLSNILRKHLDPTDPDDRLRIVHLYLHSERFRDALTELEGVLGDFPELVHLKKQAVELHQSYAQQLLREISVRKAAGQHVGVNRYLTQFPTDGIAGVTLLRVREMLGEYERQQDQGDRVIELLGKQLEEMGEADGSAALAAAYAEIKNELNFNTLNRMADYLRLADDDTMETEQKVALAISGWLLGSGAGIENSAVAASLFETRNAIQDYLRSDRPEVRQASLEKIRSEEGGAPAYVAGLIAHMLPPRAAQIAVKDEIPGFYELTTPGVQTTPGAPGQSEFRYWLQLPPEYDPHRRYPCVITLNGTGTTPETQVDWWAGEFSKTANMRQGQAARRGFIVLAPEWSKPSQTEYEYSSREHAAVLYCLRDACRRTSIDTDRVFLSGHSMGGTAAWDIGLAHPDLWAGIIPLVAEAGSKYIRHYHENGRDLPMYFVGGEKDGGWLNDNGDEFDRYLTRLYDATVVQFQGRGHEHFQDEIHEIFSWMELASHRRVFFPREFETVSLRPWDNFFWWLELAAYPPETMVMPAEWKRGSKRPSKIRAELRGDQRISIRTSSDEATVWLSPELVDFGREIQVVVNSRNLRPQISPDVEVLLEDVRTRSDRQHPFWAKVVASGRR